MQCRPKSIENRIDNELNVSSATSPNSVASFDFEFSRIHRIATNSENERKKTKLLCRLSTGKLQRLRSDRQRQYAMEKKTVKRTHKREEDRERERKGAQ